MQRLEVSGAVRLIYRSLGVKGLNSSLGGGGGGGGWSAPRPGRVTARSDRQRWQDFWTRRATVKTENLLRYTTVQILLISGQLDKGM